MSSEPTQAGSSRWCSRLTPRDRQRSRHRRPGRVPAIRDVRQPARDGVRVIVRVRTDADLDACEQLADVVHDLDRYPPYLSGDLRTFIATPGAIAAWVAETGNEVVGHVALHPRSSAAVMTLPRQVTGQSPEQFAVVARLLVAPSVRKEGVGCPFWSPPQLMPPIEVCTRCSM